MGVVVKKEVHDRKAKSQSNEVARGTSLESAIPKKAGSTRNTIFQTLRTFLGFSQQAPREIPPSTRRYLETLELAPGLKKLLGDGKLVDHLGSTDDNPSLLHTASDYSYSADKYAGDGWRVIGDAAGGSWWEGRIPLRC